MNKYDYLVKIKTSESINKDLKNLIPNLICISLEGILPNSKYYLKKYYPNQNHIENMVKRLKSGSKNYLIDTIFVLYFLILYEFYYNKYLEIKNMDDKLNNYTQYFKNIGRSDTSYMDVDVNNKYIKNNKKTMVKYYINYDLLNLQSIYLNYKILYNINNGKKLIKYLLKLLFYSENGEYIKFTENYIKLYPKIYELKELYNSNNINYKDIVLPKTIEKFNKIHPNLGYAIRSGYMFDSLACKLLYPEDEGYFAENILSYIINIKKEKNENESIDNLLDTVKDGESFKLYVYLSKLLFGYDKKMLKKINEKMFELLSELNKTDVEKLNNELLKN
ncbi:hypothetical protein [Methanothermococcus okinawensis]|uniref:Uncharacterized protein n=1 Tax=Methanothermococcus okinawensis (strain DSM 14208 / JCM 11175 / IH1) TaxID=647113 RepID=F8AKI5_METOI|nr:hypothetical protein [Methanothermococcus okinawensis]AEH07511.1 hypothetical protein Metok_1548 [Methanothermococcus okinawensis IH1]